MRRECKLCRTPFEYDSKRAGRPPESCLPICREVDSMLGRVEAKLDSVPWTPAGAAEFKARMLALGNLLNYVGTARLNIGERVRRRLSEEQGGLCAYCLHPLGLPVERKGRPEATQIEVDHVVPVAYSADSRDENLVAACSPCNRIKGKRIFKSFAQARRHILKRRKQLGYGDMIPSAPSPGRPEPPKFVPRFRRCFNPECGGSLLANSHNHRYCSERCQRRVEGKKYYLKRRLAAGKGITAEQAKFYRALRRLCYTGDEWPEVVLR